MKVLSLSVVSVSATPWTLASQAPLSMGFSRPEYWSGLPFTSPGDLPNPGIELRSPALQADSLPAELSGESKCALLHSTLGIIILFIYAHLAFFQTSPFSKHTLLSGKLLWENLD